MKHRSPRKPAASEPQTTETPAPLRVVPPPAEIMSESQAIRHLLATAEYLCAVGNEDPVKYQSAIRAGETCAQLATELLQRRHARN